MELMKYVKKDPELDIYVLDCEACKGLHWNELSKILDALNKFNSELLDKLKKNVSASDVLLDRNVDRSLVKSNVCVRIPTNLLQEIRDFAGRLNVPASDFIAYVLKYGFRSYREIKEI